MKTIRCSSLPRIAACAGSEKACEGLKSKSSAVSESGTRIHAAIASHYLKAGMPDGLEGRELFVAEWFIRRADEIIEMHGGAKDVYPEVRLNGQICDDIEISGQPDLIVRCNDGKWLVFDWKTAFAEVPAASRNVQLAGYAWLLSINEGIGNGIEAFLFSAGNKDNALTGTCYGAEEITAVKEKLKQIVADSEKPDAPRCPSDYACQYCPAKCSTRCPETLEQVGAATMPMPDAMLPANKEDVVTLWNKAKQLEGLIKAYTERVKEAVKANPEEWSEFFTLQGTGATRTIKDAQKAYYQFVEGTGMIDADKFLALVSLPVTKLEEACKPALIVQGYPVKEHKARIAEILGDNLELKEKEPSVKAVK